MNKKKQKRPGSMLDSYCLIAFDTVVKKICDSSSTTKLTLHIGSLVKVQEILDGKVVTIQIADAEIKYGVHENDLWKCPREALIHVDHSLWPYLSAVQSPVQRVSLLKQPFLCDKLANVTSGDKINVITYDNKLVPAFVLYKGPVESKGDGIFFGVELLDGSEGDNDGCTGGVRYFECRPGKGLFVSLDRISLQLGAVMPRLASLPYRHTSLHNNDKGNVTNNWRLEVGEKVIWVSEDGPKAGVVRWTSDSPDARVCVQFDEAVRNPFENTTERTKTTVLPAYQLIKACDFFYPPDISTEKDVVDRLLATKMERGQRRVGGHSSTENLVNIKSPTLENPSDRFQRGDAGIAGLSIDSLIEVDISGKLRHGIVRWIGYTHSHTQLMAGIELEEVGGSGTEQDGQSGEIRFVPVLDLRPDSRFKDFSCSQTSSTTKNFNGVPKEDVFYPELGVGSLVEVEVNHGRLQCGVVRWIGQTNSQSPLTAGVELEKEVPGLGDGSLGGHRYFSCQPGHGLFVPASELKPDSRFDDTANVGKVKNSPTSPVLPVSGTSNPSGRSHRIPGLVEPISRENSITELCGKYRGIQGHHNSCYLDATLFSMFTFSSALDSLLLRPAGIADLPEYTEVQKVLREEIVNPLRAELYVSSDRVMKLRQLMDRLSNVTGLTTEEKDPEEFLMSLLAQILRAEPFLKLSSGQEAYLYQLFPEKDESNDFPTVQQLFDQSFLASDIKLTQVPSCLIIQMPRFGKSYKMYPRILPSQVLDITDVIQHSPRQCTVCGKLALFECKECFNQCDAGLQSISFCERCLDTAHSHEKRKGHKWRSLEVPEDIVRAATGVNVPRVYMSLSAVVCIETSHYVSFVKCGSGMDAPWCFFDSMADRKGERDGYNIPEVVACPELSHWLSECGARAIQEVDEKSLPEHARRLLCDAYMCIYQSAQLAMYR